MANQPTKYRKFVVGAASAALVASAVAPVASAATKEFSDIKGNTHEENINALVKAGIIDGYEDGTFKPNKTLTRSDVVKMMGKWLVSLGHEVPADYKTKPRFTDQTSKTNDELLKYSALVKDHGVFNGYENGSLDAAGDITRENMALVLVRAYNAVYDTDLVAYVKDKEFKKDVTDRATAKAEARPYIDVLDYFDITNPIAPQFNPKSTTTRGQFATFLYKTSQVELEAPVEDIVVSATNGTITVTFKDAPETTPTAADFKVTRTINGGTATSQAPTVIYNAETKTATLTVPTVVQTDVAQVVSYSVQYKDTPVKTASFTIAAPTEAPAVVVAGSTGGNTVYVYFNRAVDKDSATDVGNYRVDRNTASTADPIVTPTRVTLNTTAVGPYGPGQVATLTFPDTTITGDNGTVRVANVKANGVVIPTTTVTYGTGVTGDDSTVPTLASTGLTDGISTPAATLSINQGRDIAVRTTATDAANFIIGGQYRIVKSDGSIPVGWTKMDPENAPFDSLSEGLRATVKTNSLSVGTYTVQVRAYDAAGNVSATDATTLTVLPASGDILAPAAPTFTRVNYSNFVVTGAQAQGARTVRVDGSVTDTTNLAAAPAGIAKVEYRVRTYNTVNGTYTTSTNWTTANPTDGVWGGATEQYNFVTPALTIGSSYVIDVRATDVYGNVGPITQTTAPTGTAATSTTPGLQAPITGTFTIAGDSIAPDAGIVDVRGTFALGTAANPSDNRVVQLGSSAAATDNTVVTGVEFAVYRISGAGARELVRGFSSDGVSAVDGAFNSANEHYTIDYTLPNASGEYVFEVVAVDAAGNRSPITTTTTVTHVLDVSAPTATIVPNASTTNKNDFIITFTEVVQKPNGNAIDVTDFEIQTALGTVAQQLTTGQSTLTAIAGTPNQYLLEIGGTDQSAMVANNILTIRNIVDRAGNAASGSYVIKASDLE